MPTGSFPTIRNWLIKLFGCTPNFEFVFDDDGNPVDVTETEPEPLPPEPPTNAELAAAIAELAEVMFCG